MTNPYFQNFTTESEQNLVEDLIIESIQIKGIDIDYLPRTLNNVDTILGEDPNSSFLSAVSIEMYFDKPEGFDNNKSLTDSIGYFLPKEAKFIVSRKRYQEEFGMIISSNDNPPIKTYPDIRPKEGDLIFFGLTKEFFEIKYVNPESTFYQLGKNYVWELVVEKFTWSHEKFDTKNWIIDSYYSLWESSTLNKVSLLDTLAQNVIIDNATVNSIDREETSPLVEFISPFDSGQF